MKVLIIGSGGREHAMAWKVAQSDCVTQVFVVPGNIGTAREPKVVNVAIGMTDLDALSSFAKDEGVELTLIGPEVPLVIGIVDRFRAEGLPVFGPTAAAARLEGSKSFAKDFLQRHGIPTARAAAFEDINRAIQYIDRLGAPVVIKADGLAAGKGVVIASTREEAVTAVSEMLVDNRFGQAGSRVIVEEFLEGEEVSFIAMVDGETVLPLASSQDHKALYADDVGPNTGGMGAYSPAPIVTPEMHQHIMDAVMLPTVVGMRADGEPYTGFLYAGLMIGKDNTVKVLEFNCRLGDPETQPVLMRLQSDLVLLCQAAVRGRLHQCQVCWDPRTALGVVMAADGYPGEYRKDDVIKGVNDVPDDPDKKVFYAGAAMNAEGRTVTSGGRVLCVTALGETTALAAEKAYHLVSQINWRGVYYRRDIGRKAIVREADCLQASLKKKEIAANS